MLTGIVTAIFVVIVVSHMTRSDKRKVQKRHKSDLKLKISDGLLAFADGTELTVYDTATYLRVMSIAFSSIEEVHEASEPELTERFENVQRMYKTKPQNVAEFMSKNLTAVVTCSGARDGKQTKWLDFSGEDRRPNYDRFRSLSSSSLRQSAPR